MAFAENFQAALPKTMAVLGDSISEGMLAEFSLERPPSRRQAFEMVYMASRATTSDERVQAFRQRYAKPEHVWATGSSQRDVVLSHFERLQNVVSDLRAYNFAVSGSTSYDLRFQAHRMLHWELERNDKIDYLILLIGANDLKGSKVEEITDPMTFANNIEAALQALLDKTPERQILFVGIPPIQKIFKGSADLKVFKLYRTTYTCRDLRRMIYGDALVFDVDNEQAQNQMRKLIKQYEKGVEGVAERLRAQYPQAQIKTLQGYDADLSYIKSLSIDCFHPSLWGQAKLAEITWYNGFWPDLLTEDEKRGR